MSATPIMRIPIGGSQGEHVGIFADEIPDDYADILDVLVGEYAPLKVWRACAVEYHRQGLQFEFEDILRNIVDSLASNADVERTYKERPDYAEGMAEIFSARAANELNELTRIKEKPPANTSDESHCAKRVVDNLTRAYDARGNEYTWLIKGFYEFRQGELKGAEDSFRAVYDRATKGQNASKRKYLFAAHIGLGIVAFSKQKFPGALDHFCKAVQNHPNCGAGPRVAIACCCFRLGFYERAKFAVEKALSLDPTSADSLIILGLLEQVGAQKDRSKRMDYYVRANEYFQLAQAIEPSNSASLNHMANHCFHTWKVIPRGVVRLGDKEIAVDRADAEELCGGDPVRIGGHCYTIHSLTTRAVDPLLSKKVVVVLDGEVSIPEDVSSGIEMKEYGRVIKLARAAYGSTIPSIRTESLYILGRLFHAQGNAALALDHYHKAATRNPEMSLATFGIAQILLSQQDIMGALDSFEKVLQKHPDDRDTLAYVTLLRALAKNEATSIEKLREVAPGFTYEVDLWLSQAQLRQENPSEYTVSLRCYSQALECMEQKNIQPDPRVLSNIAVLHYCLGRPAVSRQFCIKALLAQQAVHVAKATLLPEEDRNLQPHNPIFRSADLEGIFYDWIESGVLVAPDWSAPEWGARQETPPATSSDVSVTDSSFQFLCAFSLAVGIDNVGVSVGDEVVLCLVPATDQTAPNAQETFLHTIVSVEGSRIVTKSPAHKALLRIAFAGTMVTNLTFSIRKKRPFNNFSEKTATICYNLARVLEDLGGTKTASEIYVQLLKQHPSFIDCYLRLSRIARDMGRLDEASVWLSRALAVDDGNADAGVSLGDLYARGQHWDEAKKCYEKICTKNNHDPRTMISLGNMYFANLSSNPERYRKDSYKFFHHVLNEDPKNVYAANGLGMVCAEMGELETARDILSRAREANMPLSEDICTNLAHVHLAQSRLIDAEHLYQAALKSLPKSSGTGGGSSARQADKIVSAYECMALSQFRHGRHEDAIKSLQRGLHSDPMCLRDWFNVALVRAELAMNMMKRTEKSVDDIEDATNLLKVAQRIFSFLANAQIPQGRGLQYEKGQAARKERFCLANVSAFLQEMELVKEKEQNRRLERLRQEEQHRSRLQSKFEEKERMQQEAEAARREQQRAAAEKRKKLEEMAEKWRALPQSNTGNAVKVSNSASNGKGRKKTSRNGASDDVNAEIDFGSDDDEVTSTGEQDHESSKVSQDLYLDSSDAALGRDVPDIFGSDDEDEDNRAPKESAAVANKRKINESFEDIFDRKRTRSSEDEESDTERND